MCHVVTVDLSSVICHVVVTYHVSFVAGHVSSVMCHVVAGDVSSVIQDMQSQLSVID